MKHKVFGDYVLTAIPNAFNKKTSWWLSKKDCTAAMYCFTTSGSEHQQILESKSHIENIQSYIDCYELRFGDKQNKAEKEDPYMVETNIGMVPIAEYCDIMAMQSGYDDYADMRSHGVRLGGGMDEKLAVYNFESKILRSLEAQGFDTSKIKLEVQSFIDEEHKHCIWYGGVVATVEYNNHNFQLIAHGDVSITSYSEENYNEVVFDYSNKDYTGAYHNKEALAFFVNDAQFDKLLFQECRLACRGLNWFEVLIESPDGVISNLGCDGVCVSNYIDECIEQMILTMDDMLENLHKREAQEPDVALEKVHERKAEEPAITLERAKILLCNAIDVACGGGQKATEWEMNELKKAIGITDAELKAIGFGEEDYE